jgi:hypothetical protein
MPRLDHEAEAVSPPATPTPQAIEADLHSRIQDLNQCNEVLLSRVHQLEEALERSQQALQQEIERSQRMTEENKVAAAQSYSVAELLRDLEQANAALERQTVLAETLEAQLQTFQTRSQQLEQECTYLRQQNVEKTHQLTAAEDSCVDLRSRLQRQQRYTLQFKAALEKCLDTAAFHHTSRSIEEDTAPETVFTPALSPDTSPLVMPRSERIQPWSASNAAVPADPQLLSLMRSPSPPPMPEAESVAAAHPADQEVAEPPSAAVTEPVTSTEPDVSDVPDITEANREAEQQLWQDVERVINNTAATTDSAASTPVAAAPTEAAMEETPFTEPIPWGAPVSKVVSEPAADMAATADAETTLPISDVEQPPIPSRSPLSTETPLLNRPPSVPDAYRRSAVAVSIPALEAMNTPPSSPSPLVHPLKPSQRKRKSLAAVELPSFPPLPKVNNQ